MAKHIEDITTYSPAAVQAKREEKCVVCGEPILVMSFKGTGVHSDKCRKIAIERGEIGGQK